MFHDDASTALTGLWLPFVLLALTAAVAAWAASRLSGLNRHVREPRLARLTFFFILLAAAQGAHIVESLLLETATARTRDDFVFPVLLSWVRHLLLLGALAAAVLAVGRLHRRAPASGAPAIVTVAQIAQPLLLVAEGLLLLYLVAATAINHARRAETGSLRISLGFLLLLAALLLPYLTLPDGPPLLGPPDLLSAIALLLGTILLAQGTHPPRRGREATRR